MRQSALVTALLVASVSCSRGGGKSSGPSGPSTPTVATVSVSPATAQITVGNTQQLSASAATSAGAAVSGLTATWASSANAIATVAPSGLVTAVAAGSATITATMGGVNGAAAVTVVSADFAPTVSVSLAGTQKFNTLTIPAGVTVTASADLDLQVSGAATVGGTLKGDCVKLHLTSGGALTATGNISNACGTRSASPPDLQLVGSSVSFTNDTVKSAGNIFVTNDTTLTGAVVVAQAMREAAMRPARTSAPAGRLNATTTTPQGCSLSSVTMLVDNGKDGVSGQNGTNGSDGRSVIVTCRGDLLISGNGDLEGGNGGTGGDGSDNAASPAPKARGGNGGQSGQAIFSATGNLLFGGGTIKIGTGIGGDGGQASASSTVPGASATATGGTGGGNLSAGTTAPMITIRATLKLTSVSTVFLYPHGGGNGGWATATGTGGADGSITAPPQKGGSATATAGDGGRTSGTVVIQASDAGGFSFAFGSSYVGLAGQAYATGGKGGNGDAVNVDGASGGGATAYGGAGALSTLSYAGQIVMPGGDGGAALLKGGAGGTGTADCVSGSATARGGTGGSGGFGFGNGGAHGTGSKPGKDGTIGATDFGIGTVGARGFPAGIGGLAGFDNRTGLITTTNSFLPGATGPECPNVQVGTSWTVPPGGDPNGHFSFVNFQSIQSFTITSPGGAALSLAPATAGHIAAAAVVTKPITIGGAVPWVTITGTIGSDGTITAQGFGTVAGRSNVLVQLNGSVSATGAFTATVVAGNQVPNTLPGGAITYNVTGPAKSP